MKGFLNIPGSSSNISGLLNSAVPQNQKIMGLLENPLFLASMGLLSAGRDSRVDPFQSALGGIAQAQQFRDSRDQMQMKRDELEYRKKALEMQFNKMAEGTTKQRDYSFYQSLTPEQKAIWDDLHGGQENIPASIKIMNEIERRTKAGDIEGAKALASLARSSNIIDLGGGGTGSFNPVIGAYIDNEVDNLVSPEVATDRDANRQRATSKSGVLGTAQGQALASLSSNYESSQRALNAAARLRNHAGLNKMIGEWSLNPSQFLPGTKARDFTEAVQQVVSEAFLQARESLKGGGQITDYEGERAEQALARLSTAQSKEAFLEALTAFENSIIAGYEAMERASRGDFVAPRTLQRSPLNSKGKSADYDERRAMVFKVLSASGSEPPE